MSPQVLAALAAGLWIGALVGFLTAAMLIVARDDDNARGIDDVRHLNTNQPEGIS